VLLAVLSAAAAVRRASTTTRSSATRRLIAWARQPIAMGPATDPSSPTVATRPTRMPVAAGSRLAAALNAIEHARREAGSQYRDVVVGASGSIDKTPVSSPPGTDEHPEHRVARPFPAAWPSSRTTGPAVGPVSLNSALPRRAGRASAYYRFFGRDCWPQGQLQRWYSAEPTKDAPLLSPRRDRTSATAEARLRTRTTASVSVPAYTRRIGRRASADASSTPYRRLE
jgi:hypothetical protein